MFFAALDWILVAQSYRFMNPAVLSIDCWLLEGGSESVSLWCETSPVRLVSR